MQQGPLQLNPRAMPSLFDIRYAVLPGNGNRHKYSQNISQNAHDYEGDEPAHKYVKKLVRCCEIYVYTHHSCVVWQHDLCIPDNIFFLHDINDKQLVGKYNNIKSTC